LRLAAVAKSKQYCLSDAEARCGASCIACASRKTGAPKLSAALIFLWLLSFYQEKESDMDLWQAKNEQINIWRSKRTDPPVGGELGEAK
jgi:hypothetical protein